MTLGSSGGEPPQPRDMNIELVELINPPVEPVAEYPPKLEAKNPPAGACSQSGSAEVDALWNPSLGGNGPKPPKVSVPNPRRTFGSCSRGDRAPQLVKKLASSPSNIWLPELTILPAPQGKDGPKPGTGEDCGDPVLQSLNTGPPGP